MHGQPFRSRPILLIAAPPPTLTVAAQPPPHRPSTRDGQARPSRPAGAAPGCVGAGTGRGRSARPRLGSAVGASSVERTFKRLRNIMVRTGPPLKAKRRNGLA